MNRRRFFAATVGTVAGVAVSKPRSDKVWIFKPRSLGPTVISRERKYQDLAAINREINRLGVHGLMVKDLAGWADEA